MTYPEFQKKFKNKLNHTLSSQSKLSIADPKKENNKNIKIKF